MPSGRATARIRRPACSRCASDPLRRSLIRPPGRLRARSPPLGAAHHFVFAGLELEMIANKRIGAVLGILAAAAAPRTPDPAATLRPDALDAPAETSVREAQRAADLAASGHVMEHGA